MATTESVGRKTRLIIGTVVVLAGALLYGPARKLYEASPLSWPSQPFTEQAWRDSPKSERFRFYRDLERRMLLAGQSRQRVLDLLGAPDYEAPDGHYIQYKLKEWHQPDTMLNALFMVQIDLDAEGRVKAYFVRHE